MVWAVQGAVDLPYAIPNLQVTYSMPTFPVPPWFWRAIGHSYTAFMTECFLDELCALGGRDPLEMRLELLVDLNAPRALTGKPVRALPLSG